MKSNDSPYTNAELLRLVSHTLRLGGLDVARACLLTVHAANGPTLAELCRLAIAGGCHVSLAAWRILGPHGCAEVFRSQTEHADPRVRARALAELAALSDEAASPAPIPLRGPGPDDRAITALLLKRRLAPELAPHALECLKSNDVLLFFAAQDYVKSDDAGYTALLEALASGRWSERSTAIELLISRPDDVRALDWLVAEALRAGNPHTQSFPALAHFDWKPVTEITNWAGEVAAALRRTGTSGARRLLALYREDEDIQRRGGVLMAHVTGTAALPMLLDALDHPFAQISESAAQGLSALGAVAVRPVLQRIPQLKSARAQRVSLRALLEIHDRNRHNGLREVPEPETVAGLGALLSRPEIRRETLELLGAIASPLVFPWLQQYLGAGLVTGRVALLACERLVERRVPPPLDMVAIVAALVRDDTRRALAQTAANVLALMLQCSPSIQRAALVEFAALVDGPDAEARRSALAALEQHPHDLVMASIVATKDWADLDVVNTSLAAALQRARAQAFVETQDARAASIAACGGIVRPAEIPLPLTAATQLSVTAPRRVAVASRFLLGVWVHRDGDFVASEASLACGPGPVAIHTKYNVPIAAGSALEVRLELHGFDIEEATDVIYWDDNCNGIGNCTFSLTVPESAAPGMHLGKVCLWLDAIRIAKLDFAVEVGDADARVRDMTLAREHVRSAFASYASKDLPRVLARIHGIQKVLPDLDLFLDVMSLRSGENWEQRLYREIADRDLFLLFWSVEASRSHWVEREWRVALETKGLPSIDPVPLDPPAAAPPPPELASLHFGHWTLALASGAETRS